MGAPTLIVLFLGNLILTSYRSIPESTDSTPFNTSTGERVSISGAAISQDRLCPACRRLHHRCLHPEVNKWIHYGDCLYIEGIGFKIVNDVMGKFKRYKVQTKKGYKVLFLPQKNWLDIWMPTYRDEHSFHKKYGIHRHKVWVVKGEINE